jgi:hypothetical protein
MLASLRSVVCIDRSITRCSIRLDPIRSDGSIDARFDSIRRMHRSIDHAMLDPPRFDSIRLDGSIDARFASIRRMHRSIMRCSIRLDSIRLDGSIDACFASIPSHASIARSRDARSGSIPFDSIGSIDRCSIRFDSLHASIDGCWIGFDPILFFVSHIVCLLPQISIRFDADRLSSCIAMDRRLIN